MKDGMSVTRDHVDNQETHNIRVMTKRIMAEKIQSPVEVHTEFQDRKMKIHNVALSELATTRDNMANLAHDAAAEIMEKIIRGDLNPKNPNDLMKIRQLVLLHRARNIYLAATIWDGRSRHSLSGFLEHYARDHMA